MSNDTKCYLILTGILLILPFTTFGLNDVKVIVTVSTPPPCVINNNQIIEVDFGDVLITRIDGVNYKKKKIDYTLDCTGSTKNAMKMQIQGTEANINGSKVLQTNITKLGIKFSFEDSSLNINEWVNFNYSSNNSAPNLWAVPIELSTGAPLIGSTFQATSTLKMLYQ